MSSPNIGDAISGIAAILKADVLPPHTDEVTCFEAAKISMTMALGFAAEHATLHSPECLQDCLTFLASEASNSRLLPQESCPHPYTDIMSEDRVVFERCRSCGADLEFEEDMGD